MVVMTAVLFVIVVGVAVLAAGVDIAALAGWLRRRWGPR
jgi:hypothetical protein